MQFINVSEFYQCVLCLSIPILIIQQGYLLRKNIISAYLDPKDEAIAEEMLQINVQQIQPHQQDTLKTMLYKERNQRQTIDCKIQQKTYQKNGMHNEIRQSIQNSQRKQIEVLERDNGENCQQQKKRDDFPELSKQNVQNQQIQIQQIRDNLHNDSRNQIQMQNEQNYKLDRAVRYIRRVQDIFNQYLCIILSVILIGILTKSVYVFSMTCFFGYLFCALIFNYIDLIRKLKNGINQKSFFSQFSYIGSGIFVIALFISYWIDDQYYK